MYIPVQTSDAIELFIKSRKSKRLSPETIRWYRSTLGIFARTYPILPCKPECIYDFLSDLKAGDERCHGYYRALKTLYNFLELSNEDIVNPIKNIEAPRRKKKLPRPLLVDEIRQLVAFPHRPDIMAAILFLIDTGARVSEVLSIEPFGLSETPLGCIARITGKTGARIVPISPKTYRSLIMVVPLKYTKYRLRRLISKAFDDAHVRGSGINLRHSFGTLWEGDELMLQQIMGHAHLSTTKIYRALRTEYMIHQHRLFSPLNKVLEYTQRMDL